MKAIRMNVVAFNLRLIQLSKCGSLYVQVCQYFLPATRFKLSRVINYKWYTTVTIVNEKKKPRDSLYTELCLACKMPKWQSGGFDTYTQCMYYEPQARCIKSWLRFMHSACIPRHYCYCYANCYICIDVLCREAHLTVKTIPSITQY